MLIQSGQTAVNYSTHEANVRDSISHIALHVWFQSHKLPSKIESQHSHQKHNKTTNDVFIVMCTKGKGRLPLSRHKKNFAHLSNLPL